jgi:ketosteroid isomerase-like protein
MHEELIKLENDFARAVSNNDADAVDGFLSDDWIIVGPYCDIIDKARFLAVIKSGALSHEMMESADLRVRLYGNTAVVTGLTTTKGKFMGQDFTSCERATDIFVKQNDRSHCVFTQLTRFTKSEAAPEDCEVSPIPMRASVESNHAMELTVTRHMSTFQITTTFLLRAILGFGGGSIFLSR